MMPPGAGIISSQLAMQGYAVEGKRTAALMHVTFLDQPRSLDIFEIRDRIARRVLETESWTFR